MGVTQAQLAKLLGVSVVYLQKLEAQPRRSAKLPEKLANRLAAAAFVHPRSLTLPGGWAKGVRGEPYTAEYYQDCKAPPEPFEPSEKDLDRMDKVAERIRALQVAAGRRMLLIHQRFDAFVADAVEDLGIQDTFERELAEDCHAPLLMVTQSDIKWVGRKFWERLDGTLPPDTGEKIPGWEKVEAARIEFEERQKAEKKEGKK